MTNFCPHFDDFSIYASRASRRLVKKNSISVDSKTNKIVLNVDNSDENADQESEQRLSRG